jgi:hypothetical protein
MFLVGPTRSGKTRTVKMYIAEATKHLRAQGSSREPIIYASLTSECTPKNLNEILLQELKHPEPRKGTHYELTMRASQALIRRDVQLIIIDEMQHLTRLTSKSVAYKVADHIKGFLNTTQIPMLFVGLSSTAQLIKENGQLDGRNRETARLDPLDWDGPQDRARFRGFLDQFEQVLPFDRPSALDSIEFAARIHAATGGVIGLVAHYVTEATELALAENARCLSREHFARIFDRKRVPGERKRMNPFTVKNLPKHSTVAPATFGEPNV